MHRFSAGECLILTPFLTCYSWVKKKHPLVEPTVRIPKKTNNEFRSMSVLPYLYELHNGGGITTAVDGTRLELDDFDDDEFELFREQLLGGGYSSSGGSISRLNELTVHSMVSNVSKASKNSKSSRTSTKCKCTSSLDVLSTVCNFPVFPTHSAALSSFFGLNKTKSARSQLGMESLTQTSKLLSCLGIAPKK